MSHDAVGAASALAADARPGARGSAAAIVGAAAVAAEFIARRHCDALMPPCPMSPRGRNASATTMITKVKTTL